MPFQRVPSSGAFTGGKNRHRMEKMDEGQIAASRGDIIPPDSMPHLVIEVKHVKKGTVSDILEGPSASIDKWWEQACSDARQGEVVLLIVKEDRKSPRAFYHYSKYYHLNLRGPFVRYKMKDGGILYSCLLADLLANCADDIKHDAGLPLQENLL